MLYTDVEIDHDAPLPAHVLKYRAVREPPYVPTMCTNIYCRSWIWGAECERCGTERG
jgi:hypothetical protein